MTGLRSAVYRGGGYLAFRQLGGLLLSAAGVVLLTRLLGPAAYGLYAAALSLQLFVHVIAGWGVGTFLVRHTGDDSDERYHHALSLLLVAGTGAVALAVLALPLLERFSRLDLGLPALVLFLALPVQLAAGVPMAKIERALDFRAVARTELGGQAAFVSVGVGLAAAGFGVWAPVLGFWAQQLVQTAGYFGCADYRPRLRWSSAANAAMLRFGYGYSASLCLWQARRLVNPLFVGRYLGTEAVGYVAVALQIASQLGFMVSAAWRLSTAALAKIQTDPERTARAMAEGMYLQLLTVGPPLVAFGWIGGWLVPHVFGPAWAPLMLVYPGVAIAFLSSSIFLLQSSALYVRQRTWEVSAFHLANVLLLAGAALLFVPRVGLAGYAFAEVAALASWVVLYTFVRRYVARLPSALPAVVWLAFAIALALPQDPWLGLVPVGAVLLLRPSRELAAGIWRDVRRSAYGA
jgi:O-antigen/teichoic acid export membrane protein